MATSDLSRPSASPNSQTALPRINLFTMFRLGLFQMGLGLLSLLTLGILNQVLISELQIPAILASGAIAMYQFMSPARVWMGQMSDAKPIRGYHRSGYNVLAYAGAVRRAPPESYATFPQNIWWDWTDCWGNGQPGFHQADADPLFQG